MAKKSGSSSSRGRGSSRGKRGGRGGHSHGAPNRRRYNYPEGERPESAIDVVDGSNGGEDEESEDENDSVSASLSIVARIEELTSDTLSRSFRNHY